MLIFFLLICVIILFCLYGSYFKKIKEGGRIIDKNILFEPLYSRKLNEGKEEKFYGRHIREMISLKLGQRKLLFNELEFYTMVSSFLSSSRSSSIREEEKEKKKVTVIYPGAAAGFHSTFLLKTFPDWEFHFYDMNPFAEELKAFSNLKLYHQYFTDEDAFFHRSAAKEDYIIFLSDIRSGSDEEAVDRDMALQRKWIEIIKPDASMLKFRLPWRDGQTEYFDGDIYTQPRIGPSSTETRLIFFGPYKMKMYDNESYNNRIFYWQRHNRNAYHSLFAPSFSPFFSRSEKEKSEKREGGGAETDLTKKIKGLCHCYDCWSEIEICKTFLKHFKKEDDSLSEDNAIIELMNELSVASKSSLDIPPHNLFINETDINKKISLLEKTTKKYFDGVVDKFDENMKKLL